MITPYSYQPCSYDHAPDDNEAWSKVIEYIKAERQKFEQSEDDHDMPSM